ncbi:hypothetical protein V6Z11_D03G086800 [Gossypium hirsutum]|uniref:Uncharacterized protein isoform X5 n=1 Tax=Gossypium hirsutum TaxID=3635 RepID=A0A1U8NQ40_GOSHI|nr:uncharacterized protein LOC107950698 isoform X5 [Gossypium hirsutum]
MIFKSSIRLYIFQGPSELMPPVVENYKDFAFLDYARVGRALALYEVGDKEEAFAEMEDVSISLKGYPGETFCLWQGFLFNSHFKTFSTLCWDKVRCWDKQKAGGCKVCCWGSSS